MPSSKQNGEIASQKQVREVRLVKGAALDESKSENIGDFKLKVFFKQSEQKSISHLCLLRNRQEYALQWVFMDLYRIGTSYCFRP